MITDPCHIILAVQYM